MSQKITEKEVAQSLLDSAYVLITQPEADITGQEVESLRRIPLSVLLKKFGGNGDGEVDPEVVKQIVDEYLAESPPSGVTDQEIADAVEKYLTENPVEGVTDQQVYDAVAEYLTENPVESVTDEEIAAAVANYLEENPITPEGIGALPADELPEAINEALAQAKASGDFKGDPGEDGYSIFYANADYTYEESTDGSITINTFSIEKIFILNNERDIQVGDLIVFKDLSLGRVDGFANAGRFVTGSIEASLKGAKGDAYELTNADKQEIAEQAAQLVEVPDSPTTGSGLTAEQITALDNMFKVCAFTKADVSAEYNAFCAAFGIEGGIVPDEPDEPVTPAVTLTSISATYSGGNVAVGTAVNDLTGIVVTAHYSDGTSESVTGYTLSGTIAEGSNTVTVTYQSKTATFTVTGVAESGGGSSVVDTLSICTNEGYLKTDGVTIGTQTNCFYSENIDVSTVQSVRTLYRGNFVTNGFSPFWFYDENDNPLSGATGIATESTNVQASYYDLSASDIPENAKYLKIVCFKYTNVDMTSVVVVYK